MEERTYTQKELYLFVTEYSKEAREEGFDMSVGDFVDWVASKDEKEEAHKLSWTGRLPNEQWRKQMYGGDNGSWNTQHMSQAKEAQSAKPVLPEKLDLSKISYTDVQTQLLQAAVNQIIDYLS